MRDPSPDRRASRPLPSIERRRRRRRFRAAAGVLVAIGFALVVVYRSFHAAGYRCEVCITFNGQQACRTVEGPTEAEARSAVVNNACAVLAAGVTETLACERTVPDRLRCEPLP
jgi:ferric-dicitrate binding protein FerR (iron transport regulator)